jgi:hypothetical protein
MESTGVFLLLDEASVRATLCRSRALESQDRGLWPLTCPKNAFDTLTRVEFNPSFRGESLIQEPE